MEKTHYRKAFHSPYLSSADIVEPVILTISHVLLEINKTKKSKDSFNTAYFVEKEIRPGEPLKPMVLNVINSKVLKILADSPFIDDWKDIKVQIHVDENVKFGRDTVEGLRISSAQLITESQLHDIIEIIAEKGADKERFLKFMGLDKLEDMPSAKFQEACTALRAKK